MPGEKRMHPPAKARTMMMEVLRTTPRSSCWLLLLLLLATIRARAGDDNHGGGTTDASPDWNGPSRFADKDEEEESVCQRRTLLNDDEPETDRCQKEASAPKEHPLPHHPSPEDVATKYGVVQSLQGYDASYLLQVDQYFQTEVAIQSKYDPVRNHCLNEDAMCTYWATIGECDKNPSYMRTHCAPACLSCHLLLFEERCPFNATNATESNVWQPGDLDRVFERLISDPSYQQQYNPQVLCRPGMINEKSGGDCPWIVILDDFLSVEECETLIELGSIMGYKRSEDVGARKPDGTYAGTVSEGRTSTNAWCQDACHTNDTVQNVLHRMEDIVGITDDHYEYLQLLRYEVGQFYESHHDYIEHNVERAQGPRILTVFLYLNHVEQGGSTTFTDLDLVVSPKRGRALVWPSVLNDDPNVRDGRTHHQADAVEVGVKYGANAWVRTVT